MRAPLIVWVLLVVVALMLVGGAGWALWVSGEVRDESEAAAQAEQVAIDDALRSFSAEWVAQTSDIARGLSEGARARLKDWLEQEPLALYRQAGDPHTMDVDALMDALVAEVRTRSREERERVRVLVQRLTLQSDARIAQVVAEQRDAAATRTASAAKHRVRSLWVRLGILLVGLAGLLALLLAALVVRPLRRTQSAVQRIAGGALTQPLPQRNAGATELLALSRDVERMREQIQGATHNLEAQVAAKTASLRAAQDRLVQSAKMAGIGTLAGGVAHEFNNLLGGILGCIESARRDSSDERVLQDLDVADRTARRASVLVRALLDVARPGQRQLGSVDLQQVIDDVLHAAAPAIERQGAVLKREGEPPPPITGDAGQLHQVVLNLVTNALQAVAPGDPIVVRTGAQGGHALVEVRDAGPGVPAADRTRIFEPFFTGREHGTGLGLFVSYGIVERHGGRIEVDDGPEGGARFRITIPAHA